MEASDNQVLAKITMDIFKKQSSDGVINMVTGDPEMITDIALKHPNFLDYTWINICFKVYGKIGEYQSLQGIKNSWRNWW